MRTHLRRQYGTNACPTIVKRMLRVAVCTAMSGFAQEAATAIPAPDADTPRFVSLYIDRVLDSLEGRRWLVTNGTMDDALLRRARDRGIPLHCLNLAMANRPEAIETAKASLGSLRLRHAADLGLTALVTEWISSGISAGRDLALMLVPDFWHLGEYESLPNGLVFLGVPPTEIQTIQCRRIIARHEALWDEIATALAEADVHSPGAGPSGARRIVAAQASFVGNNLGFLLETLGKEDDAFGVYNRVHEFDPENVSALLNWAAMVLDGRSPELKGAVELALDGLNKKLEGNALPIWSLSRVYGYVSSPAAFAQLGWSWASSGQPRLAIKPLERAATTVPHEQRKHVMSMLARLHLLGDRPEESERVYLEMLVEDAGNHDALMGLVRIVALRGDSARAWEYLARAEKAGVPRKKILTATALVARTAGDTARAKAILQAEVEQDPSNIDAWSHLCALLTDEKDVGALNAAVDRLEEAAGSEDYAFLIAKGGQAMLAKDLHTARGHFARAQRLRPTAVVLLEQLLNLDFQLADTATAFEHARMLLRLDGGNSLANFIMGSLAAMREDWVDAEDYLRRSVETAPGVANLNDLAVALLRLGDLEEAELRVQQALRLDGRNYAALDTHGQVLLAKGALDEAEAAFREALKHETTDVRVHLNLVDVLIRKNDLAGARDCARTVSPHLDSLSPTGKAQFDALQRKLERMPAPGAEP